MPISAQGVYTGLLGYSLRKEFFGEGLNYRQVEVYNYEFVITDLSKSTDLSLYIENQLKTQLNLFSGDVTITSYQVPASQEYLEHQINVAKYLTTVEVRKPLAGLTVDNSELLDAKYYYGLSNVISARYNDLNSFTESFDFTQGEEGQRDYTHSISFSLRTGDKAAAQSIAVAILGEDYSITGFGVNVFNQALKDYGNESSSRNYYNETYNLLQNSYSFNKRKSLLPITGASYSSEIKHSLDMGEDGVVNVTEELNVVGKYSFAQALAGLDALVPGSYDRCSGFFGSFSSSLPASVDPLKTAILSKKATYNKAGIEASMSLSFTNDPTLQTYYFEDATLEIQRDVNSVISMTDTYSYTMTGAIVPNMDTLNLGGKNIVERIYDKKADSLAKCQAAYSDYGFDTLNRGVSLLNYTAQVGNRSRTHSATFKYTDDGDYLVNSLPILATNTNVNTFKKVSVTVDDTEPVEQFSEYIIINRPSKTSVLSPNFQSSPGTRSVNIAAVRERPTTNQLTSPSVPSNEIKALYDHARRKLLQRFVGSSPILLTYHLSNLSYSYNNRNEISLSAEITYTEKQRSA